MRTGRTKDGRYVIRPVGAPGWVEVSKEEYEAAKAGPIEALGRGAVEGVKDLVGGAMRLAGGIGSTGTAAIPREGDMSLEDAARIAATAPDQGNITQAGERLRTNNDPTQRGLREAQPVTSAVGELLPELAAGGFGRGIKTAVGIDAALGAMRDPDNPIRGAAIGGTIGGAANLGVSAAAKAARATSPGVRKGVEMARAITTRSRRTDSVNAQRVADPTFERTARELEGFITPERAKELGFRLTPGETRALNATSADELAAANRARDREDLISSTQITGTPFQGSDLVSRWSRDDHRQAFTSYIGDILDEPNVDTLTNRRLGQLLEETQQVFKENIDELDAPIPAGTLIDDVADMAEQIGPTGEAQLAKLAKDVESLTKNGELDKQATTSLMNLLEKRTKTAFDAGNYELGSAYSAVRTTLNDAIVAVAEKVRPGAAVELKQARKKYGIIKSLQRGRAVDPGGIINPSTFRNNYAKTHRRYASGKDTSEFAQVLDTVTYLNSRRTGDSGTAARLAAKAVGSAPALAAGGGAAAAGYDAIFGR
ncbi:hypothetical protein [Shimia aestuarii]|uniref:Uncharacterized protein n=1 Tax=Shimia aestuarii TaxID=254406 RepID=A0A1I4HRA8_9RHOB|nr:hypothetical protein [Shimia aestuarii]SFL44604.1 hypothetical protein SAMN04488042_101228 [Shimia aestuarii]